MNNKKPLLIIGDSSFAQIACEYFSAIGREIPAFLIHRQFINHATLLGKPVLPLEEIAEKFPPHEYEAFVAITYREINRVRARLCIELMNQGYSLASYISPHAFIASSAKIGWNCFVFENNVIQPFVTMGNNVILWSGNHIGHHSTIEDNVFVASHVVISGHCKIGRNSFIGVNATISNNVSVAADCWIGPSSLIMKDTQEGQMFRSAPTQPSPSSVYRFFKVSDGQG